MRLTEILLTAGVLVPVAFFFATARLLRRTEDPNPKLADGLLEGVRREYERERERKRNRRAKAAPPEAEAEAEARPDYEARRA